MRTRRSNCRRREFGWARSRRGGAAPTAPSPQSAGLALFCRLGFVSSAGSSQLRGGAVNREGGARDPSAARSYIVSIHSGTRGPGQSASPACAVRATIVMHCCDKRTAPVRSVDRSMQSSVHGEEGQVARGPLAFVSIVSESHGIYIKSIPGAHLELLHSGRIQTLGPWQTSEVKTAHSVVHKGRTPLPMFAVPLRLCCATHLPAEPAPPQDSRCHARHSAPAVRSIIQPRRHEGPERRLCDRTSLRTSEKMLPDGAVSLTPSRSGCSARCRVKTLWPPHAGGGP